MKIVYLTNILNHYQFALSECFSKIDGIDYTFIATTSLPEERIKLGIPNYNHAANYCICAMESQEQEEKAFVLFQEADACIVGMTPRKFEYIYKQRLRNKKVTFFASERIYKKIPNVYEMPLRKLYYLFKHSIYKSKYMLCASAFTAGDYALTGNYIGKTYKWGYFPDFVEYNVDDLFTKKKKDILSIVWVGRYLNWKHPEGMIYLAKYLSSKRIKFEINMIGTGDLFDSIRENVASEKLEDYINILGPMPPEEVRRIMEKAHVFAFTSDRGEGWGVVLNEAMNSGCVPVGSEAIGSVPYLIQVGTNGYIFKDQKWDELGAIVEMLATNPDLISNCGKKAYQTIKELWNPQIAAERFCILADCIINNKKFPYQEGPCSVALPIRDLVY